MHFTTTSVKQNIFELKQNIFYLVHQRCLLITYPAKILQILAKLGSITKLFQY